MRIIGTQERPRLSVHKSLNNMHAQIIDDTEAKTLLFLSTSSKEFKTKLDKGGNIKSAQLLAEILAKKAVEKGIKKIVFDRGGYPYHGRVKVFAESLRKGGLEF